MSVENNKQWYIDNFTRFESHLNGEKNLFPHAGRRNALEKLAVTGFPTLKEEEWKYTNVAPIIKNGFYPAYAINENNINKKELEKNFFCGLECHRLVFINGLYSKELSKVNSLPKGAVVASLRDAIKTNPELVKKYITLPEKANAFTLLNNAYNLDGLFVYLPKGSIVETPVQVLFINGNGEENVLSSPRNIIAAEENSSVNLVFSYLGAGSKSYFTNVITDVHLGENASVSVYKIQNENDNSYHIEKADVIQGASSRFNHYSVSFGGSIVRNDINSSLEGENGECHYYGLYLANGNRHIDNHTFVDHASPNCLSNELYKGILDDEARGVFNGKIVVRPDAQKTNAYQTNRNILLTDEAKIHTKPQLEIFADDVKCSHGATVGRLDETAYFYIRSRGVPAEMAKSMLIRAFANDVIESVKIPELKEQLNHMIFSHLNRVEITNQ